ncbi:hypothetical protein FCM35_KLT12320 [Carex littledalei]|uniref:Uncharacterized protein n=1 Tax=Carex littledalei TaxID=544730 RepID=A0A833QJ87_9POAL|nr:hypothetical protein FCM35_KLT12320 [Carex littledalei]
MCDRTKQEIPRRISKPFMKFLTGMLHCTSISPVQEDYEKLGNRISVQEFDLHASHSGSSRIMPIEEEMLSLDQKLLWMERITHMAEVNNLHVKSLARKLEEKREVNRELRDQIEVLLRENKELKDQNNDLLNQNKSLREIIQVETNECTVNVSNSMNKHETRKFKRLKIQLLNACCIRGERTEHEVRERVA